MSGINDTLVAEWAEHHSITNAALRALVDRLGLNPRASRLLAAAAARDVWEFLTDPRSRAAVEVAERFVDGRAPNPERVAAARAAKDAYFELCARYETVPDPVPDPPTMAADVARFVAESRPDPGKALSSAACVRSATPAGLDSAYRRREHVRLGSVLAAVAGPGYALPAEWRTEATVGLARTIDADQAWAVMPVLADALDDAGCTDPAVVAHCRGPGPFVRGDWVVDSLLGRR